MTDNPLITWMLEEGIARNKPHASNIFEGLQLYRIPDDEAAKARVRLYREYRSVGLSSKLAFTKAIDGKSVSQDMADEYLEAEAEHYKNEFVPDGKED